MRRTFANWISVFAVAGVAVAGDAQRALVVYNESEPESQALAQYYAQRRGIPAERLCAIRARNAETITRKEFEEQIRKPIRDFLLERGLMFQLPVTVQRPGAEPVTLQSAFEIKISFIVLIYGVPLRIDEDPTLDEDIPDTVPAERRRNAASVDSELAVLPSEGTMRTFAVPNPFFNKSPPVFDAALNNLMVLVTRLDGPDAATVRRMIDDALRTEAVGLLGRCYIDTQNSKDPLYMPGDEWLKAAGGFLRDAGFETVIDERGRVFDDDFLMSDAAVYAGWYAHHATGAVARAEFKFRPGAVAYHLHSMGAATLRSRQYHWAGPLLDKGAAATFGSVYEPYLALTPRVDLFFKRLLAGATFAEAGWHSQPVLSWQTVFVGDPLYRPFALSLDGQIARLESQKHPDVAWAYLRKVNMLLAMGDTPGAEKYCAEKATATGSWLLIEKLAAIQKK